MEKKLFGGAPSGNAWTTWRRTRAIFQVFGAALIFGLMLALFAAFNPLFGRLDNLMLILLAASVVGVPDTASSQRLIAIT